MSVQIGDYAIFSGYVWGPYWDSTQIVKNEVVKIIEDSQEDLHGYYLVEFQNVWIRRWLFFKRRKVTQVSGSFKALSPLELLAMAAK